MTRPCQLEELSCVGCCGHDFASKEELSAAICKNSLDLKDMDLVEWRDRKSNLLSCGLCANIVRFEDGSLGCALHPESAGQDLRIGHCNSEHLCMAAFLFQSWNEQMQARFIQFIKSKNLDWYAYSLKMDNDELIKEFLAGNP